MKTVRAEGFIVWYFEGLLKQLTLGELLGLGIARCFGEFDPAAAPVCPAMHTTRSPLVDALLDTHTRISFQESFPSPALFTCGTTYM